MTLNATMTSNGLHCDSYCASTLNEFAKSFACLKHTYPARITHEYTCQLLQSSAGLLSITFSIQTLTIYRYGSCPYNSSLLQSPLGLITGIGLLLSTLCCVLCISSYHDLVSRFEQATVHEFDHAPSDFPYPCRLCLWVRRFL